MVERPIGIEAQDGGVHEANVALIKNKVSTLFFHKVKRHVHCFHFMSSIERELWLVAFQQSGIFIKTRKQSIKHHTTPSLDLETGMMLTHIC